MLALAPCNPLLVSESSHTPYSGMLPGYIAGYYRREECFIDLRRVAAKHNADLLLGRAVGIVDKRLQLADGREIAFDLLSINSGAAFTPPFVASDSCAASSGCAVKPIEGFIDWLGRVEIPRNSTLAVVGGGAGGVETALALAGRLRSARPAVSLVSRSFLKEFPPAVRLWVLRQLWRQNIAVEHATATNYADGKLSLSGEKPFIAADKVVFATGASPPPWLANTGLPLDERGFVKVNRHLQSVGAPHIYVTGDAASHTFAPPKSGVMAVRQGPVLAHNLLVAGNWRKGEAKAWRGRRNALYIIGNGGGEAIACRNGISFSGKWVWRWKCYLDERFIRKFA